MDRFIKRDNIKYNKHNRTVQNSAMELGADFFFFFLEKRKVNMIFTRALRPHIDSDQTLAVASVVKFDSPGAGVGPA